MAGISAKKSFLHAVGRIYVGSKVSD